VHTVKDPATAELSARGHFVPVSRLLYIVFPVRQHLRRRIFSELVGRRADAAAGRRIL